MSGARAVVLGLLLAVLVSVAEQGLVKLVAASGAKQQPALLLVLLLAAFLGVVTAVLTRMLRLPGATAATALVLGWIVVPPLLGAIPSAATSFIASDAALSARDAIALAVATIAATVTLAVPAER